MATGFAVLTIAIPSLVPKDTNPVAIDWDHLLSPEELEIALAKYDPKDVGIAQTTINGTDTASVVARDPYGFCGDSSFNCETSNTSPPVLDCFYMYNVLMSRQEEWDLYLFQNRLLAWVGSCCFSAENLAGGTAYIGGLDIADLTRDSINRCRGQPNDLVGSWGEMPCPVRATNGWDKVRLLQALYNLPY